MLEQQPLICIAKQALYTAFLRFALFLKDSCKYDHRCCQNKISTKEKHNKSNQVAHTYFLKQGKEVSNKKV